jgi:hypothetical protein
MKIGHIKIYFNGQLFNEYYNSESISLFELIPGLEKNKLYRLHYLFKYSFKIFNTDIINCLLFQEDQNLFLFQRSRKKNKIYLKELGNYNLTPTNLTHKLVLDEENNLKIYLIMINSKYEIFIGSSEIINLYQEIKKKFSTKHFEIQEIETYQTCRVTKTFDVLDTNPINKINVKVELTKKCL